MDQDQVQPNSEIFPTNENEYKELKKLIKSKGLLEKQPAYYVYKLIFTFFMFLLALSFLLLSNTFWLQLLDAIYLGFVSTQLAFIAHDAGHRQIARATWKNDVWGFAVSLLIGVSYNAWVGKHNQHHSYPNQPDLDPDMKAPFFSFTEEQALRSKKFSRLVAKYEAYLLIVFLSLWPVGARITSINFLIRKKGKYFPFEIFLLGMHFLLYFGILFLNLIPSHALLFFIVHQLTFGLYAGSAFAPNHKGMPILDKDNKLDFLRRQVITSRNIKTNPFIDFWYGGLNYQIEHHLFPSMPRNKLREAQPTVKAFCQAHFISYHETTAIQSIVEIFGYVNHIGYFLRKKPNIDS